MPTYKNISGDSGIRSYGIGPDFIKVVFKDGGAYTYTFKSAGVKHVSNMMELAVRGKGLTTYINQHVKDLFEERS
ncbi:MAG: hypothetical protein V4580_19635 [Bacteroidota bacterium]